MIEIGRLAVKIAGRDAGKKCAIIDILEPGFVLIDGETRRRKCNIKHLEFLEDKIDIEKGADRKTVIQAFKKIGIELKEKKAKTVYTRPLRKRELKTQAQMEKKAKEKAQKQETKQKTSKTTQKKTETTKKEEETKKKENTEEKKQNNAES